MNFDLPIVKAFCRALRHLAQHHVVLFSTMSYCRALCHFAKRYVLLKVHTAEHYEVYQLFIEIRLFMRVDEVNLYLGRKVTGISARSESPRQKFLGPKFV